MKKLVLLLWCTFFSFALAAQEKKPTVSGYVKDLVSGESLPGAVVSLSGANVKNSANSYGFFSLSAKRGRYELIVSYVGYTTRNIEVDLLKDTTLNIGLEPASNMMSEVVVSGSRRDNVSRPVSVQPLSIAEIKQLPPFLGEADLIKSFQLLPGVTAVGDGASGFNVRGGGVDQNLVLLDEAPLYFTSHLFNLFSVANPDAVKDAALYKTEMPARFGGRLSSVMDIHLKDGNNQRLGVEGGIGLIASRLMVEGPLKKDKSSFIVSARRSYTDLLTKSFGGEDIKDNSIYFYDLSAKVNIALGSKDKLFVSGYFGKDRIDAANRFLLQWGSSTGTLRWNHVFSPRLFANTSVLYSDYKYRLGNTSESSASGFIWNAGIKDYTFKNDFSWYLNSLNNIHFGFDLQLHEFQPGIAEPSGAASAFNTIRMDPQRAAEYNLYWDHELTVTEAISVEYGLRANLFQSLAKDGTIIYDYVGATGERKLPVNGQSFADWKVIKNYLSLQPRLALKVQLNEESSLKAAYSRATQNLHLVSNTISSSPLDIWTPSSYNVKPEIADQFSLGYFRDLKERKYSASVEMYYRKLGNQIDYIDGAETLLNEHLPGDMLFGTGRAYGAEFYLRKNSGRLNGWGSYTLGRTERRIEGLNQNEYYPAPYDKTHNLVLVGVYQAGPRLSLSATYNFATGAPATLPDARFEFEGVPVQNNTERRRNNYRISNYHRLDLSATLKNRRRPGRRFSSEWVFSAFNALNRRNAFTVYMRQNEDQPANLEAVRFSMFGSVIPSVTWNFKF